MNINSKTSRKWCFSYEKKHQYHLSKWDECLYGAQSLKEMRLLCEIMFNAIEGITLIIKIVEGVVFLMKPKH